MKRRLRTLFYGLSHEHAAGKLETLGRMADDFEIVAVVDDRPRRSPTFINDRPDPRGYRIVTEDEADEIDNIDVVFVEVANRDLMEIAAKYAARGIAMHCDKPCGEAMEPYRSVVETCRAKKLPFQIGYMYRGNPALRWIWRYVSEGRLGEIAFVEADMNHAYDRPGYADYIATFRGGILYNLGCHLVDMTLPLVRGELTAAHPFADGTKGASLLRFGGTDVLIRTSCGLPGGILARRLRIDGTKGTIDLCPIERFDGRELVLCIRSGGEERTVGFGVQTDRYAAQLLELAAIVRGERPNDQDYDQDLRVHELTLRACGL